MTMRKREEIEQDLDHIDEQAEAEGTTNGIEWGIWRLGQLQLETLLDIRDMLMPPQPVVIKMTDEEQREFMTKWNQVTKGG